MSLSREAKGLASLRPRGCERQDFGVFWAAGSVSHSQAGRVELSLLSAGSSWQWRSVDGAVALPVLPASPRELTQRYDLCVTGEGLAHLQALDKQRLLQLIPHVQVFARVVPKQKVRDFGKPRFRKTPFSEGSQQGSRGATEVPEL